MSQVFYSSAHKIIAILLFLSQLKNELLRLCVYGGFYIVQIW